MRPDVVARRRGSGAGFEDRCTLADLMREGVAIPAASVAALTDALGPGGVRRANRLGQQVERLSMENLRALVDAELDQGSAC